MFIQRLLTSLSGLHPIKDLHIYQDIYEFTGNTGTSWDQEQEQMNNKLETDLLYMEVNRPPQERTSDSQGVSL